MTEPDEELARLVGEVAIASARAEYAVRTLLTDLLESPYGAIILAQDPLSSMIEDCLKILQLHEALHGNPQRAEPVQHLKDLKELAKVRNQLVHGMLARSPSSSGEDELERVLVEHNARRKPAQSTELSVSEVRETVDRIRHITGELTLWTVANLNECQQIVPTYPTK